MNNDSKMKDTQKIIVILSIQSQKNSLWAENMLRLTALLALFKPVQQDKLYKYVMFTNKAIWLSVYLWGPELQYLYTGFTGNFSYLHQL